MIAVLTVATQITDAVDIETEIAAMADLALDALRLRWRNMFGSPAPERPPKALLAKMIAYRRQAEVFGDLHRKSALILKRMGSETPGAAAVAAVAARAMPPPGALLLREWNGQTHRVAVMQNGFAWNGVVYGSLSRIAREITGVNWNGFVFFGLAKKAGAPRKPASGKELTS